MELKDYLHLYIGSSLQVEYGFEGTKKMGILAGYDELYGWQVFRPNRTLAPYLNVRDDLIKPILRPLTDISEPDCQAYNSKRNTLYTMADMQNQIRQEAASLQYLLSHHYDVFGLIEAGLAIDSTTLDK